MSLREAKRQLRRGELEEFRWTVQEYVAHGESLDPKWRGQLENASARVHISRLEALQVQCRHHAYEASGKLADGLRYLSKRLYTDAYYHTAYEIQRGMQAGGPFALLSDHVVEKAVSRPWAADGLDFSQRVWRERDKLAGELHTGLTQALIRGDKPDKLAAQLAKRFDVSRSHSMRLVQTESAFFCAAGQRDCYHELDVERYEVVGTLDSLTCPTCGSMDGRVFPMADYEPGTTAPPFHPSCRCCTCPYFEDMQDVEERAARDEDGKVYYVAGDVTFDEWKRQFVDGEHKHTAKYAGTVDFADKQAVYSKIEEFERLHVLDEIESCFVVTPSGDMYVVEGDGNTVMRAFDEKYIYEVRKTEKMPTVEEFEEARHKVKTVLLRVMSEEGIELDDYEEQKQHVLIREICKALNLPYERWLRT